MAYNANPNIFCEYTEATQAKCVAAIDFGTSGTGYAFAFPKAEGLPEPRSSVFPNGQWADGKDGKTKTALLLDDNNNFLAFGKAAQNKYRSMAVKNQGRYFEHFKMQLYDTTINDRLMIKAMNGVEVSAKIVFSECLKYLKRTLLEQINRTNERIEEHDIKWILTVPAIWSDAAKHIMRDAARMASLNGIAFQLALEPEAASLWVLLCNELDIELSTKYMVCDCGGGTIDVTVHQAEQHTVKDVIPPDGGNWGSTAIDGRILDFLKEVFGLSNYDKMLKDHVTFSKLLEDIETAKVSFDANNDVLIVLPDSLVTDLAVENLTAYSIEHGVEIELFGPNLLIPAKYFYQTFIFPTVNKIASHIQKVLDKHKDIGQILLVGNFANCRSLQLEFNKRFSHIRLIVPNLAGEAIMKGAVLFGSNPALVTHRKSRFTYGKQIFRTFQPRIHPEIKAYITKDGRKLCSGVFDVFVTKGDEVSIGEEITRFYHAVEKDQTSIRVSILKANRTEVNYITDPDVQEIGSFILPCTGPDDRVKFTMIFSSEILAKAINSQGQENQVNLIFND